MSIEGNVLHKIVEGDCALPAGWFGNRTALSFQEAGLGRSA
jgi:hypothetical protein